ncbi:hypothetical protein T484DRAFT_1979596 [Baffinella frigidus]|nr:hypothetical protein T484DRAFT_1979596 [Cryptophyta sp. CCMP2293]
MKVRSGHREIATSATIATRARMPDPPNFVLRGSRTCIKPACPNIAASQVQTTSCESQPPPPYAPRPKLSPPTRGPPPSASAEWVKEAGRGAV